MPELGVDELRQLPIPAAPAQCDPSGLFRELLKLTPVRQPVVECVTSADEDDPRRLGEQHRRVLAALGISAVDFLSPLDPREADRDASLAERIRRADIVFLCGGDQSLLKSRFGGTAACHVLRDRFWNDDRFVLAGNSAGAMILADEMITGDGPQPEIGPSMGTGWHFVNGSVDTHVGPRRRRRLGKAVRRSRSGFGIGVTTQAALVLKPESARVYGGPVIVVRRHGDADGLRPRAPLPPTPNVTGCESYARDGLAATIYQPGESLVAEDRMRILRPRG